MQPSLLRVPIWLGVFALALSPLVAADKADLTRTTPAPAGQPIPISDFFRPALLHQPQLNDAGTHLAALVNPGEDRTDLLVYNLETKSLDTLCGVGNRDIYHFSWLDDQRIIFNLAHQKIYGEGLFLAPIDRLNDGYPLIQYCAISIIGVPEQDRGHPLIWMQYDSLSGGSNGQAILVNAGLNGGLNVDLGSAGAGHSDAMDVRDNNSRHVFKTFPKPAGSIGGYLADKTGNLAFAYTYDSAAFFAMHQLRGDKWQKCPLDLEQIDIVDSGEKPGELVVQGTREPGAPRKVMFMDAATGTPGEILLHDAGYDFNGSLYRTPKSQLVVGCMFDRVVPQTVWFSKTYQSIQALLDAQFKGQVARILGSDREEQRFLVAVFSDVQPAIYYLLKPADRSVGLIKSSAPWIDPARMRPMSALKFKTRDGHVLDAYLTLPVGASKQSPAPLVVLPHGGPWVRDTWGFDSEVQFLASRGYAVLQPNYRGSTGYDWMFPIEDQWAFRKMHDDVTDATKTALRTGLVDPSRVAIMGGSFGGYLAISGVVNEPNLYRCAVTVSGIFDWAQVLRDQKFEQYFNAHYAYMKRKLGDPAKQKDLFDSISPVRHIDQVRVPVFVAHGKEDWIADISESRRLIGELKRYKVPNETFLPSGEGHGMSQLKNQIELYARVEAFLARNMAPLGTTTSQPKP